VHESAYVRSHHVGVTTVVDLLSVGFIAINPTSSSSGGLA